MNILEELIDRYPELCEQKENINSAFELLKDTTTKSQKSDICPPT